MNGVRREASADAVTELHAVWLRFVSPRIGRPDKEPDVAFDNPAPASGLIEVVVPSPAASDREADVPSPTVTLIPRQCR